MARPLSPTQEDAEMAQFSRAFMGVPNGEIYPREFQAGDECPPELEAAARELGALASDAKVKAGSKK
jgi:hypothetical protein